MTLLRDPFSQKPYVGFYVCKRLGGCLLNDQAVKLLKVSMT
jgi:HK97 family phage major capsid protein